MSAPTPNISDQTLIQIAMDQGKTEQQAKCALKLLKRLRYNSAEVQQIFSDPSNRIIWLACTTTAYVIIGIGILISIFGISTGFYELLRNRPCLPFGKI